MKIKVLRSNNGHRSSLMRINKRKNESNGFYGKGEFEKLEKSRIYHISVYNSQLKENIVLSKSRKKKIWNSIKVDPY